MFEPNTLLPVAPPKPVRTERRVAVRYPSHPETVGQCRDPRGLGPWQAWIRDISATGICLLLERRFAPGTELTIDLENPEHAVTLSLSLRIVHTLEFPNGDWLHGAAFTRELRDDELRALVE